MLSLTESIESGMLVNQINDRAFNVEFLHHLSSIHNQSCSQASSEAWTELFNYIYLRLSKYHTNVYIIRYKGSIVSRNIFDV